jgi:hypothetical protein
MLGFCGGEVDGVGGSAMIGDLPSNSLVPFSLLDRWPSILMSSSFVVVFASVGSVFNMFRLFDS